MFKRLLLNFLPHIAAILILIVFTCAYFAPQLQGKTIIMGDIVGYDGMAQEARAYYDETGRHTLWTNSIFGGMPTYQMSAPQTNNIFISLLKTSYLGFDRPLGYFLLGCFSAYIMFLIFGVNPWLSLIGAFAFAFTTNNLVLYEAGHTSKTVAIMASPLVVAGLYALFRKRYLLGGVIFALGLGMNVTANHYQMTYFLGLLLLIYYIIEAFDFIKRKDFISLGKITGIAIFSLLIAIGASSTKFFPTYEFSKDTMRGTPILTKEGVPTSSSETEGLEFNYAMQWSNGFLDLFSSFIPGVVGGSNAEIMGKNSKIVKELRKLGVNEPNIPIQLYWGKLPFTSGPVYFGAVIFFLLLVGFGTVKGPIKWWIAIAVVLTLLISMGKNFEGLNRFIFDNIPFYNKFRAPNSILSVTSVLVPILGFKFLHDLTTREDKKSILIPLYIVTAVLSAICLYFAFIGPGSFNFKMPTDPTNQFGALIEDQRKILLKSDSLRSLGLILGTAISIWSYTKFNFNKYIFMAIIGLLIVFDLYSVGKRYLNLNDFVPESQKENVFVPREVDKQILRDNDPHYRVYDQPGFQTTSASYFHKTIGGYNPAKLQRFDDLIYRHIAKGNQRVLDMLNAKYFITNNENNEPSVIMNSAASGNAWFINNIINVENANQEIDGLSNFDPNGDAIIHKEFNDYIAGLSPQKNGSIRLTSYAPDILEYTSSSDSEQLAVFSEIWYGPNKGWQAYIDDEPVEHIRANYALRALRIPSGSHKIVFEFKPSIFSISEKIALFSSILFVLGLLGFLYSAFKGFKESDVLQISSPEKREEVIIKKPDVKTKATKIVKTTSKRTKKKKSKKKPK